MPIETRTRLDVPHPQDMKKTRPAGRFGTADTHLADTEHPEVEAKFSYRFGDAVFGLETVCISARPDDEVDLSRFRVAYPWGRWEKAARIATLQALDREGVWKRGLQDRSPRIEKLMAIAEEYRQNLSAGVRDPVGEIARRHEVKPSTARSWIYRARQRGLLGPGTSRTAGEAGPAALPS